MEQEQETPTQETWAHKYAWLSSPLTLQPSLAGLDFNKLRRLRMEVYENYANSHLQQLRITPPVQYPDLNHGSYADAECMGGLSQTDEEMDEVADCFSQTSVDDPSNDQHDQHEWICMDHDHPSFTEINDTALYANAAFGRHKLPKYLKGSKSPASLPSPVSDGEEQMGTSTAEGPRGRFMMGYRKDCIKCINRTPGHFMHLK
jgi:hypothetical protein